MCVEILLESVAARDSFSFLLSRNNSPAERASVIPATVLLVAVPGCCSWRRWTLLEAPGVIRLCNSQETRLPYFITRFPITSAWRPPSLSPWKPCQKKSHLFPKGNGEVGIVQLCSALDLDMARGRALPCDGSGGTRGRGVGVVVGGEVGGWGGGGGGKR